MKVCRARKLADCDVIVTFRSGSDRRYAKSHEWVTLDGTTATVGISDYAQVSTKREDTRDVNWKLIHVCY